MTNEATATATVDNRSVFHGVLTEQEQDVVYGFLTANESAEKIIPDTMPPETLWRYLAAACKAMARVNEAVAKLKPMIGRMLFLVKRYPDLYESQGYANYPAFMGEGVPQLFQISRAEAYAIAGIAEVYPELTPQEYAEIGVAKLKVATSAVKRETTDDMPKEMKEKKKHVWLTAAQSCTLDQMSVLAVERQTAEAGEFRFGTIVIRTNEAVRDHWQAFIADNLIQGYAETGSPGLILDRMIDECQCEWKAQMEQQLRAKNGHGA